MEERPVELQNALDDLTYPATKAEVVAQAEHNGADADVLQMLNDLPERNYERPEDITAGIRNRL